jgi:hypothetical protein
MDERRPEPGPDERDERATKPPGEGEADGRGDEPAATEAPGPHGNPGVSEEALRNRQQDQG